MPRLQGWNDDDIGAVLATLVQLTTHDAGRVALVSAGVPAMAVRWLSISCGAHTSAARADQQQDPSRQPSATAANAKHESTPVPTKGSNQRKQPSLMEGSECAAKATDADMASLTLQLLRLMRNLCAAGPVAADALTAAGAPAQLAQLVMERDAQSPGDALLDAATQQSCRARINVT